MADDYATTFQLADSMQSAVEPPADPLPWTDEMNDLFLRMVELAWVDLHVPDRAPAARPQDQRTPIAKLALDWLERGAPISYEDRRGREREVSLIEVWGWDLPRLLERAREAYASRAAMPASRNARIHARSTLRQLPEKTARRVAQRLLKGEP